MESQSSTLICLQATGVMPELNTVKSIQKIAWAASSGSLNLIHSSHDEIHEAHERHNTGELAFSQALLVRRFVRLLLKQRPHRTHLFLTRINFDGHQKHFPLFSMKLATQEASILTHGCGTSLQTFLMRVKTLCGCPFKEALLETDRPCQFVIVFVNICFLSLQQAMPASSQSKKT